MLLLLQNEKPERRHTFASLALRKRYSYLAEPALSECDIFTNKAFRESLKILMKTLFGNFFSKSASRLSNSIVINIKIVLTNSLCN